MLKTAVKPFVGICPGSDGISARLYLEVYYQTFNYCFMFNFFIFVILIFKNRMDS